MENMWLFEEIERQFNIRFDITQVSEETWSEKKSTAFATNVLPDLCVGTVYNGINHLRYARYAA